MKEITFHGNSELYRMSLIESNSKLLITDWKRNLLHLVDLEGNILNSFNPNNIFKDPTGVCILIEPGSNEEKIFVGDEEHEKIFVLNSNFELKFQFGDGHLKQPGYLAIDNEFEKSCLYVSDSSNNKITVWNTANGTFIDKIDIDSPNQVNFTRDSLFVSSPVFIDETENNLVFKIKDGGNCIFEIDKVSLEIKKRIIGNWFSPELLNIDKNGNLQIIAHTFYNNITKSEMLYFLTIDPNSKIIKKVEISGFKDLYDVILVNDKVFAIDDNKLKIFEFE